MTKKLRSFATIMVVIVLSIFLNSGKSFLVYSSNNLFHFLKIKLIQDGFSNEKINDLYGKAETYFDAVKVARYFCHNEAKLNYNQFTDDTSMKDAFAYMEIHNESLVRTEKKYGVSKEIITAILLVETRLGKYVGENKVFSVLSNIAALMGDEARHAVWENIPFEYRTSREVFEEKANNKSVWAYKELKDFLKYVNQQAIDPLSIKGSYAGAMGIAQFMPSSLFLMSKGSDIEGKIDLFNHSDAICSVANYLRYHGWDPNISKEEAIKTIRSYNNSTYYVNTIMKIANILKS